MYFDKKGIWNCDKKYIKIISSENAGKISNDFNKVKILDPKKIHDARKMLIYLK